jgi:Cache domain
MLKKVSFRNVVLAVVAIPLLCVAQPGPETDAQSLLSAFVSYTDLRIGSVQRCLEILASTAEVKSGQWKEMEGLLAGYQKSDDGLVVWFVLPDGTYYTADRELMDVKLNDRSYFPDLMAGRKISGALVVSKSTGKRSAVIAVPMQKDGKVVGAVGASVFLDVLSDQLGSALALPKDASFFALTRDGLTALHTRKDRHFLDPRELGGDSLKRAANEMLSKTSGEVVYEFDNVTKKATYRTSPLTQWRFVITFSAAQQK